MVDDKFQAASADAFNRWVDGMVALPGGTYTHDQLRALLWLAWSAALDVAMSAEPTAHTLTLLFHRLLTEAEWREVVELIQITIPYVVELRADAVCERPEQLFTDGWNPLANRKLT